MTLPVTKFHMILSSTLVVSTWTLLLPKLLACGLLMISLFKESLCFPYYINLAWFFITLPLKILWKDKVLYRVTQIIPPFLSFRDTFLRISERNTNEIVKTLDQPSLLNLESIIPKPSSIKFLKPNHEEFQLLIKLIGKAETSLLQTACTISINLSWSIPPKKKGKKKGRRLRTGQRISEHWTVQYS